MRFVDFIIDFSKKNIPKKLMLLAILFTIITCETIQNTNELRTRNFSLSLPQITSPYLFSSKQMNLKAIGGNLNPQFINLQQIKKLNDKVKYNKTQSGHQQILRKQNQPNSNLKTNQQKDLPNTNISQSVDKQKFGELIVTKNQQTESYKAQFQKIDLKKLTQEIEKQQRNKKINAKNQSQKNYQSIFGPIKNQSINNSSKYKVQQRIKNGSSYSKQSNQGQFEDLSANKDLNSFNQAQSDQKLFDFNFEMPNYINKYSKQVSNEKQQTKNQLQARQKQNKYESQLLQKQAYKQQYEKLLKQVQQLKDNRKVQQPKTPKMEENHRQQDKSNKKEKIVLCLNLKTIILLVTLVILIMIYCLCKKQKSSAIQDRYSLEDDQKIPSDQMDQFH